MAGIEERVKEFLGPWEKRKSGSLPSPDLSVSCSVCGAAVMGDEYPDLFDGEIVCQGCRGSITYSGCFSLGRGGGRTSGWGRPELLALLILKNSIQYIHKLSKQQCSRFHQIITLQKYIEVNNSLHNCNQVFPRSLLEP